MEGLGIMKAADDDNEPVGIAGVKDSALLGAAVAAAVLEWNGVASR
jgi:hypothetical protein